MVKYGTVPLSFLRVFVLAGEEYLATSAIHSIPLCSTSFHYSSSTPPLLLSSIDLGDRPETVIETVRERERHWERQRQQNLEAGAGRNPREERKGRGPRSAEVKV